MIGAETTVIVLLLWVANAAGRAPAVGCSRVLAVELLDGRGAGQLVGMQIIEDQAGRGASTSGRRREARDRLRRSPRKNEFHATDHVEKLRKTAHAVYARDQGGGRPAARAPARARGFCQFCFNSEKAGDLGTVGWRFLRFACVPRRSGA